MVLQLSVIHSFGALILIDYTLESGLELRFICLLL